MAIPARSVGALLIEAILRGFRQRIMSQRSLMTTVPTDELVQLIEAHEKLMAASPVRQEQARMSAYG
jgi:hypothetical protein